MSDGIRGLHNDETSDDFENLAQALLVAKRKHAELTERKQTIQQSLITCEAELESVGEKATNLIARISGAWSRQFNSINPQGSDLIKNMEQGENPATDRSFSDNTNMPPIQIQSVNVDVEQQQSKNTQEDEELEDEQILDEINEEEMAQNFGPSSPCIVVSTQIDGIVLENIASAIGLHSIRSAMPKIYFEVIFSEKNFCARIGFCDENFNLHGLILGTVKNTIGIECKDGSPIKVFCNKKDPNATKNHSQKPGAVIGIGIKPSKGNSRAKCFITAMGNKFGSFTLPDDFSGKYAAIQFGIPGQKAVIKLDGFKFKLDEYMDS